MAVRKDQPGPTSAQLEMDVTSYSGEDELPFLFAQLWQERFNRLISDEWEEGDQVSSLEAKIITICEEMVAHGGRAALLQYSAIADSVALHSSAAQSVYRLAPRRYLAALASDSAMLPDSNSSL